jgi:hypothetical protein
LEEVVNLEGVPVEVGDIVHTTEERGFYQIQSNNTFRLGPDVPLRVTAAYTNDLLVRLVEPQFPERGYIGGDGARLASFQISRRSLVFHEDSPDRPRPRRLGQKPDDSPDVPFIYIGIDDPGIQWLWDDMGKYAEEKGYCKEYDALVARLGIPGRPRNFDVKFKVGEYEAETTVRARSQREANELVEEARRKSASTFTDAA